MNEQQTGREKMTDNIEQYKNCLDGLTKDMPEEFFKLAQVFELSVFEPIYADSQSERREPVYNPFYQSAYADNLF